MGGVSAVWFLVLIGLIGESTDARQDPRVWFSTHWVRGVAQYESKHERVVVDEPAKTGYFESSRVGSGVSSRWPEATPTRVNS